MNSKKVLTQQAVEVFEQLLRIIKRNSLEIPSKNIQTDREQVLKYSEKKTFIKIFKTRQNCRRFLVYPFFKTNIKHKLRAFYHVKFIKEKICILFFHHKKENYHKIKE